MVVGVDESGETFFVEVVSRTMEVLNSIISEFVDERSNIFTDETKSYGKLNELGFFHFTVNRSRRCVNPVTGPNTKI
jgi:transposase-like protein